MFKFLSFYKFITLGDIECVRSDILSFCLKRKIKGTVLLAEEGVNVMLAGRYSDISDFCSFSNEIFGEINFKKKDIGFMPFKKMKVKIKDEIITFNVNDLDMKFTGEHLNSKEWENLLRKKDAIIVDTRNYYEYAMGTFVGAINPHISNFTELRFWIDSNILGMDKNVDIGMFCTGGIRCEKSTAYLKQHGFKNVYQLKDGIIKYIDDKKDTGERSLWYGKCFVFDDRVVY